MNKESKNRMIGKNRVVMPRGVMIVFCYVLPALLVAALIISGVWGSNRRAEAEGIRRTAEGIYRQAYTELAESVYNMQLALSKLTVSEAPSTLTETLDDIWRESGSIAALMGRVPQSHTDSYELNRFMIQVGDYAKQLSRAIIRGGSLSEEDRGMLMEVYTASEQVFAELSERLRSGSIPLEALSGEEFFSSESGAEGNAASGGAAQDEAGPRYPSILYDGPFSDSTENMQPRGLSGDELDENAARRMAKKYLDDENCMLEYEGIAYGKIPYHSFTGTANGRRAEVAVSVQGGALLYMRLESTAQSENAEIPDDEELKKLEDAGKAWLKRMDYDEMEATYAQYYGDRVLISFAAVQRGEFGTLGEAAADALYGEIGMSEALRDLRSDSKGGSGGTFEVRVILYNDLVKLWLERESGEVVGADAENYLFSHVERPLSGAVIGSDEAAKRLSPMLEVEKTALALIPLPDQSERLCHEFTGSFAGSTYLIYLDACTGDEVRIFRLINDENGSSVL